MNSRIILAKDIKMDRNYNNVLSYNEDRMLQLCLDNVVNQATDYTFIRQTGSIMTNFTYEECLQANYIAFQNTDYSNKWFFAWIDDVIYKGNRNTEIRFTVDSWSTWFSYWQKKVCYIVRQHTLNDIIGANIVPENLAVEDVIEENMIEDSSYTNEYGFYVALSCNYHITNNSTGNEATSSAKGTQFAGITVHNNNIFGNELILFKIRNRLDFINIALYIARTNTDDHIEDIINMFILPNVAISEQNLTQETAYMLSQDLEFTFYTLDISFQPEKFDTVIPKITNYSDYTPKNNKCFVYPYNYLFLSNNNGSNNIYKYEDFSTENCVFENQFSISIGGSGRVVPKNYKGMATNDDEALTLGKYPTCSWSSDAFTNWLTHNSVNLATSLGLLSAGIASTIATSGATMPFLLSTVLNLSGTVAKQIGDFRENTLAPNISGGQSNGDIIWSANKNTFTFRQMRIKTEYLKIIDDYFTRFGYAVKKLEMPNITGRRYYNYVEIGSTEEIGYGSVPSKFMKEINDACRKGVTIWHNHSNLGDYSLNNIIE